MHCNAVQCTVVQSGVELTITDQMLQEAKHKARVRAPGSWSGIPHQTTLHYTTPHQTTPNHTKPHQTTPHRTTPHHITTHHTTTHNTTKHKTSLYQTSFDHVKVGPTPFLALRNLWGNLHMFPDILELREANKNKKIRKKLLDNVVSDLWKNGLNSS